MSDMGNILIIEDDATQRRNFRWFLEDEGYSVNAVDNGEKGLSILTRQKETIDVLLLDLIMPTMGGVEVLEKINQMEPPCKVHIVIVTAVKDSENMIKCLRMGAHDYIIKPYRRDELLARVGSHASARCMERQLEDYANRMERLAEARAQQLIHADRLVTLGTMSAGIAHEVNNPIQFILANIFNLQEDWQMLMEFLKELQSRSLLPAYLNKIAKDMNHAIGEMQHGSERILDIVGGLRTFARKGSGDKAPVDIGVSIDKALRFCWHYLKYGIDVVLDIPQDLPQPVVCAQKLEQVFVNLISNAAHAMEKKGILRISAREVEDVVRILFDDDGPGIPESALDTIWEPFFTTKNSSEGTGLGLAICKGIIKEHKGVISCGKSSMNGARFTIELPIELPDEASMPPLVGSEH